MEIDTNEEDEMITMFGLGIADSRATAFTMFWLCRNNYQILLFNYYFLSVWDLMPDLFETLYTECLLQLFVAWIIVQFVVTSSFILFIYTATRTGRVKSFYLSFLSSMVYKCFPCWEVGYWTLEFEGEMKTTDKVSLLNRSFPTVMLL